MWGRWLGVGAGYKNLTIFPFRKLFLGQKVFFLKQNVIDAGILKQSMGARNREGIGLPYWPARLHRLVELVPWNRFSGSIKVQKFGLCCFDFGIKGTRLKRQNG
jgi:hypothetical protein